MESMDNVRERFEALEQQMNVIGAHTRTVERRLRGWRIPWRVTTVAALGLALIIATRPSQAADFACAAGDVACLITAINTANAAGEANTITLEAGTYTLTDVDNSTDGPNGLPSITSTLTIKGDGADTTILERASSAPSFRLVHVAASGNLWLAGVTIRGGGSQPIPRGQVDRGGGLYNNGGTVTVRQSTIVGNHVLDGGGGLFTTGGTVLITHSHVTGNGTNFSDGGGLAVTGGTVSITQSTVADNSAENGGGIRNDSPAVVTLVDSTVVNNGAPGFIGGGGITNGGLLLITNSTVAHNSAFVGGGLENFGTTVILNATIADNSGFAGPSGGISSDSGTVTLQNTILRNIGDCIDLLYLLF
jgi:hypothetical protein